MPWRAVARRGRTVPCGRWRGARRAIVGSMPPVVTTTRTCSSGERLHGREHQLVGVDADRPLGDVDHWEAGVELAPPDRWLPVGGCQRTVGADEADRFRQHLVVLETRRAALQHEVDFVTSSRTPNAATVPARVRHGPRSSGRGRQRTWPAHSPVEQTVPEPADRSRPRPQARAERGRGVVGEVRVRAVADPRQRESPCVRRR